MCSQDSRISRCPPRPPLIIQPRPQNRAPCVPTDLDYTQYLFAEAILGSHDRHYPRHAKRCCDLRSEYARLQREGVAALTEFRYDVATGRFHEEGHLVRIAADELEKFLNERALSWSNSPEGPRTGV